LAGEHALITLAQETGGKYYYADATSLDRTFAQLSEDLRTQYLLAYYPSNRSGKDFRSITVKLRDPSPGYIVRNRPGYYPSPLQ
jgi:Ca-activated chloride channel family protein